MNQCHSMNSSTSINSSDQKKKVFELSSKEVLAQDLQQMSEVSDELIRRAFLIEDGSLTKCFARMDNGDLKYVLRRIITHFCINANHSDTDKDAIVARCKKEVTSTLGLNDEQHMDGKIDFYKVRKAHLRFMTRTGCVIGLQQVRNLANLRCV